MAKSSIQTQTPPKVYIGSSLSSLSLENYIYPTRIHNAISPGTCRADFTTVYGSISRGGAFTTVPARDLSGKYVRVTLADVEIFAGIIQNHTMQPAGTATTPAGNVPSGDVTYHAIGLDSLLDQVYPDGTAATTGTVETLHSFNGTGQGLGKNRSAAKSSGRYLFSWADSAETWTARDIIEHYLTTMTAQTEFFWSLGTNASYLDYITVQLDPTGKTMRGILNELIQPSDGFAWRVSVSGSSAAINIISLSDSAVTDFSGSTIVPANNDTMTLTSSIETDRTFQPPQITRITESAYETIEIYSEPIRVTATLKLVAPGGTGGLAAQWSSGEETTFAGLTDAQRGDDEYRHIFADFALPENWDGLDFEGVNVLPSFNKATSYIDFTTPSTFLPGAHLLERTFPLASGKLRKALLLLKDPDGNYIAGDRTEKKHPPVGVDVSDDECGIHCRCPNNVLLAKNHFSGTSEYAAYYDYTDALVTVSFCTDQRLAATVSGVGTGTKKIYIPNLHLWVTTNPNTKTSPSATLSTPIQRDDRDKLRRLAAMMKTWYGRERNTLSISSSSVPSSPRLGKIITECYSGGAYTPIGTIVSAETYIWDNRGGANYSIQTDFCDLNFTRISRRRVLNSERCVGRRLRKLEEAASSTPLRPTVAAVGGGGGVPVRITGIHPDSPTGDDDVRIFRGNAYANGSEATASAGNVTIRIMGLAAGVENYPTSPMLATPISQSWTNAAAATVTETVYEVNPFAWWGVL